MYGRRAGHANPRSPITVSFGAGGSCLFCWNSEFVSRRPPPHVGPEGYLWWSDTQPLCIARGARLVATRCEARHCSCAGPIWTSRCVGARVYMKIRSQPNSRPRPPRGRRQCLVWWGSRLQPVVCDLLCVELAMPVQGCLQFGFGRARIFLAGSLPCSALQARKTDHKIMPVLRGRL